MWCWWTGVRGSCGWKGQARSECAQRATTNVRAAASPAWNRPTGTFSTWACVVWRACPVPRRLTRGWCVLVLWVCPMRPRQWAAGRETRSCPRSWTRCVIFPRDSMTRMNRSLCAASGSSPPRLSTACVSWPFPCSLSSAPSASSCQLLILSKPFPKTSSLKRCGCVSFFLQLFCSVSCKSEV